MKGLKCEICNILCNIGNIGNHVHKHKISLKEYYDSFLKKDKEGFCITCRKKTRFIGAKRGYHSYCSTKCSNSCEQIKEKKKETCLKNYGVESPFQNKEIQQRIKNSIMQKYGVENPSQSEILKQKRKETCLKNYGTKYPMQSKELQQKRRDNNVKKYGVENPSQLKIVKEKVKATCLKKYGVESSNQDSKVKEKKKQACMQKYGVENPSQSEIIKKRKEQTYIHNYGVPNYNQTEKAKNASSQRMLDGGAAHASAFIVSPSKPQVELFHLVKSIHEESTLNFPVYEVNRSIDVAIPSLKIAIEYDGSYWHQDIEKDLKRQKSLEDLGWKFIRYRDKVPSLEKLKQDIISVQKILKTNISIYESFSNYVKYPRTYHLPWSETVSSDDKKLKDTKHFENKNVVITIKLDGEQCLDGDTEIITEIGNKSIKDICDNRWSGKVLSYNFEKCKNEYQHIEGYSIINEEVNDDWFELKLENGVILKLTGEHKVWVLNYNCYKKVKDLQPNEDFLVVD